VSFFLVKVMAERGGWKSPGSIKKGLSDLPFSNEYGSAAFSRAGFAPWNEWAGSPPNKKEKRLSVRTIHSLPWHQTLWQCLSVRRPEWPPYITGSWISTARVNGWIKETASPANIATQRANRNPRGVFFLSGIAREAEAGREEEVGAAVMNPQLSGLAAELGCRAFRGGGLRQGARGW